MMSRENTLYKLLYTLTMPGGHEMLLKQIQCEPVLMICTNSVIAGVTRFPRMTGSTRPSINGNFNFNSCWAAWISEQPCSGVQQMFLAVRIQGDVNILFIISVLHPWCGIRWVVIHDNNRLGSLLFVVTACCCPLCPLFHPCVFPFSCCVPLS